MDLSFRNQLITVTLACCLCGGCKVAAPIHLWRPPQLASAVGGRVVVSELSGEGPLVAQVRSKLFESVPSDFGRNIMLVDYRSLSEQGEVKLVSATDEQVNDLALASLARRSGADFLLRGEVIESRASDYEEALSDQLTISWSLTSLAADREGGGLPVSVTAETAIQRYPDLALLASSDDVLTIAAVRETYRLMLPTVDRETIEIESSYALPGSRELRRANELAKSGNWAAAEKRWERVRKDYPFQIAAMHNLALAAVARQDYSKAKELARSAIRFHPSALHQQTLVWIETRQRAYHKAFGLPDPPEGWFLTRSEND